MSPETEITRATRYVVLDKIARLRLELHAVAKNLWLARTLGIEAQYPLFDERRAQINAEIDRLRASIAK